MDRHLRIVLATGVTASLMVASSGIAAPEFVPVTAAPTTAFGFNLLRELERQEPRTNLFISPLSVALALAMTYNGAEGETKAAMAETLALTGIDRDDVNAGYEQLHRSLEEPGPSVELAIANSIWTRAGFEARPEFLDRNQRFYDAEIASLDFDDPEAANTINRWVDENTFHKIPSIVEPPIDPLTVMFLINAAYFKGVWTILFDIDDTRDGTFHRADGTDMAVSMMRRKGGYDYYRGAGFEAVQLAYGDGRLSMYLFLPDTASGLSELLPKLNVDTWHEWLTQFHAAPGDDDSTITMPRFKVEYDVTLNDSLKALGMGIAFDPGRADFAGINPDQRDLHVSSVKHKTFVEVNEVGTEAAAVTSVEIGVTSVGPAPVSVVVDRPFFFVIHDDETGTVLFSGLVHEPVDPGKPDVNIQGKPASLDPEGKLGTRWGEIKSSE